MSLLSEWILEQLDQHSEPNEHTGQQPWFPGNPEHSAEFLEKKLSNQRPDFPHRAAAITEWQEFLAPWKPHAAIQKNFEKLQHQESYVIATGQQPGILGGPFYSISKAISAVHWAKRFEKETGRPVVPVFWIASDDHDFEEVATTYLYDKKEGPVSVSVPMEKGVSGQPVSVHSITSETRDRILESVRKTLPRDEYAEEIIGQLNRALSAPLPEKDHATFESQFIALMLEWLGPLGVIPVVPSLPFLRKKTLELFEKELESAPETSKLLVTQDAKLTREYQQWVWRKGDNTEVLSPSIHRKGTELNFFWHRDEGRCRLEVSGDHINVVSPIEGKILESLTKETILDRIRKDYQNLSPNAALRPLVQDGAFPNLATIGGFGELGYHAKISVLYSVFDVQRPLLIPRTQLLLVTPGVERFLDRVGYQADQIKASDREKLTLDLMHSFDSDKLVGKTGFRIRNAKAELEKLIPELGPARDGQLEIILRKMSDYIDGGEKKIEKRLMDTFSDRKLSAEISWNTVWDQLLPDDSPQERSFGAIALLLAWNGPRAVEHLAGKIDGTLYHSVMIVNLREVSSEF